MAKYGSFKYGAEKYGFVADTGVSVGEVTWILDADWGDDGEYSANESEYLVNVRIDRGRRHYLQKSGNGFEKMPVGKCVLTLDNSTRRFDPYNSDSPLYGDLWPGVRMQLRVKINSTGAIYTRFTGNITDIRPEGGRWGGFVRIELNDYGGFLEKDLPTSIAATRLSLSAALHRVLDTVSYPGARLIDVDSQPIIMLDATDKNALDVCNDLAHAGLGTFFIEADGRARFYSRSDDSFTIHNITESLVDEKIGLSQPWDDIYNQVEVICNQPIKELTSVIWFLPAPISFTSGNAFTVYIKFDPAEDISIGKIKANTTINDDGTDITADLGAPTITLGYGGGSITYTPTASGYLTKLEIRGRIFKTVKHEYIGNFGSGTANKGLRIFRLDNPYLQDRNYAAAFAANLSELANNDETITIAIHQRPTLQYAIDLMDSIYFVSDTLELDGYYNVQGIEEEWQIATGQDVTTIIHMREVVFYNGSITPAPVEEISPPLGYKNPAGDPDTLKSVSEDPESGTTDGSGAGAGGASAVFVPECCFIAANGIWTAVAPDPPWINFENGAGLQAAMVRIPTSWYDSGDGSKIYFPSTGTFLCIASVLWDFDQSTPPSAAKTLDAVFQVQLFTSANVVGDKTRKDAAFFYNEAGGSLGGMLSATAHKLFRVTEAGMYLRIWTDIEFPSTYDYFEFEITVIKISNST